MSCTENCFGQLSWLEVPVSDAARARNFYIQVFSWDFNADAVPDPSPSVKSMHFFSRGKSLHGAFSLMKEGFRVANHNEGVREALPVLPSFHVKDCNETLKKVEELGGKVQFPRTEIGGGMGFYARFIDTEGNMIGIWAKA